MSTRRWRSPWCALVGHRDLALGVYYNNTLGPAYVVQFLRCRRNKATTVADDQLLQLLQLEELDTLRTLLRRKAEEMVPGCSFGRGPS